jgi:hypothetical protein
LGLIALFLSIFLLFPPTVKADTDNILHELAYDDIQQEVMNRSPVMEGNCDDVDDGIDQLDDSLKALEQQEVMFDDMSASLIAGFITIEKTSTSKASLLSILSYFPESLSFDADELSDPVTILKSRSEPLSALNLLGFVMDQDSNDEDMWFCSI